MATFSKVFSSNSAYTLYLDVTESSYSIENNNSVVAWTLRAVSTKALQYGSWEYGSANTQYRVYINGTLVGSGYKTYDFRDYKTLTVASGSTTVAHNDDGTKVVACSASYCGGSSPIGSATASGNLTLTTIPRYSDITCNTPVEMGSTQTVTVTQKSTAFSHILYYSTDGGTTFTEIGRGTATGTYSWIVPNTATSIPNADSATYILKCDTFTASDYSGTALVKQVEITATVPANYVPTIAITSVTEGNSVVPSTFPFIVGFSKLNVRTTFTGSAGSTCAGRAIQVGNEIITNTSSASVVDTQFQTALTNTSMNVLATTTDSRGRTGTATQAVTAYAYQNPNIAVDLTRCDSDGTINPLGTYLLVRAKWSFDSVNNLNSAQIKVYLDDVLKHTYSPTVQQQDTWTDLTIISGVSASSQYTLVASITDLLLTATVEQNVSKAVIPLSPYDDGNGVGVTIGRMSTGPGFRSAVDNYFVSGTETNLLDADGRNIIKTIPTDDLFNGGGGLAKFVKGTPINLYDTDGETVLYSRNPENLVFYDGDSGDNASSNFIYCHCSNGSLTTSDVTVSSWTASSQKGSGFEISGGQVKCNKNGYVRVFTAIDNYVNASTTRYVSISKNGTNQTTNEATFSSYGSISSAYVMSVVAGDLISVRVRSDNTTSSAYSGARSYLYCEYVEDYYITQNYSVDMDSNELQIGNVLIQWGTSVASNSANTNVSFTKAYTQAPLVFMTIEGVARGLDVRTAQVVSTSTTGFSYFVSARNSSSNYYSGSSVAWLSIGLV